jgi:hypothetical protein
MRKTLIAFAIALSATSLQAAGVVGTVTITEKAHISTVRKVIFAWVAGTGDYEGTASGTTTLSYDGELLGLTTDPGAGPPTDNYDITIKDSDGDDVLLGAGTNRDTTVTEHVAKANLAAVCGSKLTLAVAAAGSATEGKVILYIR